MYYIYLVDGMPIVYETLTDAPLLKVCINEEEAFEFLDDWYTKHAKEMIN